MNLTPEQKDAVKGWVAAGDNLSAVQTKLAAQFKPLADELAKNEEKIVEELNSVQGEPVDIGGYYRPDLEKITAAMRPSETFNEALAGLAARA